MPTEKNKDQEDTEKEDKVEDNSNFISILSDYGFKLTFADESDTTFLRRALQALIQSEYPIEKVKFLSNEFIGLTKKARAGLYDLICEDENSNTFIVEMQLGVYKNYIQRAKFYAFQRFNTLVKKGEYLFDDLTPIYCIGFLANSIFKNSEQYYHIGTLKNKKGEELDTQITHIIVEIAKFGKKESELITDLDKLIYFMKNQEIIKKLEELPEFISEDWIDQAINKLDKSQMNPEQLMHFEMMLARNASIVQMEKEEKEREIEEALDKALKEAELRAKKEQKKAVEETKLRAKEKQKEAVKEAVKEAELRAKEKQKEAVKEAELRVKEKQKEVVKEAVKEAELRAKEEKKGNTISTAKEFKKNGIAYEIISKVTGLSIQEIEALDIT